jgi:DNA primase
MNALDTSLANPYYLSMPKEHSIVDEILSRADIVDVVSKYVPLKKSGVNFSGCCPFHHEKTPSFIVSPQKQIFKCFGCGVGGNVFTFVQEIEKIDFRDAVKLLAEHLHLDMPQYKTTSSASQYHHDEKEKLKRMHKLAQDFFVKHLQQHKEAMTYLKEKRKLSDEIITSF